MKPYLKEIKELAIEWLKSPIEIYDMNILGTVQHPFFDFIYTCDENGVFDIQAEPERFAQVIKAREKFINRQRTLYGILCLMRKSYRIYFLKELYELEIADEKICGNALGEIWSMLENNNSTDEDTKNIMLKWLLNADKDVIMDKSDLHVYDNLSERITVYRGIQPNENIKGFSWSLSQEIAEWFAQRYGHDGNVYSLIVDKKHVIAYINNRNEKEIIVDYTKINDPVLI